MPADHVDCLDASLRRELDQILTHSGIRSALDDPVPFLQVLNAREQHMGRERVNHGHRQLLDIAIRDRDKALSRCRNLLSPCPADTGEEHLLTDLQMADTRTDLRDFTHALSPG